MQVSWRIGKCSEGYRTSQQKVDCGLSRNIKLLWVPEHSPRGRKLMRKESRIVSRKVKLWWVPENGKVIYLRDRNSKLAQFEEI